MSLAPGIAEALSDIVGPSHVVLVPAEGACGASTVGLPDAVVYPGSTAEVAHVIRGAKACELAVWTPEGVLLKGEAGEIFLDLGRLNKILEISAAELVARVQSNVLVAQLKRGLGSAGLQIAGQPQVGALAGNAHVMSVDAVSVSGLVTRISREPRTGSAEAIELMIHMSGTNCLVTEYVIALMPMIPRISESGA